MRAKSRESERKRYGEEEGEGREGEKDMQGKRKNKQDKDREKGRRLGPTVTKQLYLIETREGHNQQSMECLVKWPSNSGPKAFKEDLDSVRHNC